MALSKKTRFEIFKRDSFTCQYCGQHPPAVILEVDHVQARAVGGLDEMDNLVTSCFDCNRGKAATPLSSIPQTLVTKAEILREREEQLKEYTKILKKRSKRIEADIDAVQAIFRGGYPSRIFTDSFRRSIKNFLSKLPVNDVMEAMQMAVDRTDNADRTTKYFCGVCWRLIKGQ